MMKAIAFSKGHISIKIPQDMAATQYLGFLPAIALAQERQAGAPPNSSESP